MSKLNLCLFNFLDKGDIFSADSFIAGDSKEALLALADLAKDKEINDQEVEILEIEIQSRKIIPLDQLGDAL